MAQAQKYPEEEAKHKQMPVPKRVYIYEVDVGQRHYVVTLPQPIPKGPAGKKELHDQLLNNKLVDDKTKTPKADVRLAEGTTAEQKAEANRFNNGTPNQRLDVFRDRYLGQTYQNGQYVDASSVNVAPGTKKKG
jgi:hypothetical protein